MARERFDFLKGETVTQLWFWGMTRLVFDRPSEAAWYVEVQRCHLVEAGEYTSLIDAAGLPLDSAPMLQLLRQTVTDAAAEDGVLTLCFENGLALEALEDDEYESRTVAGPNRVTQCLAGGETTSW